MAKVRATLLVDEDMLKEVYKDAHPEEEYSFEDAFRTEMGWAEGSGISLEDYEVIPEEDPTKDGEVIDFESQEFHWCPNCQTQVTLEERNGKKVCPICSGLPYVKATGGLVN